MDLKSKSIAIDGNLVTARSPDDLPTFMRESISLLAK
jgi:putative intracellular protease/amidase